MEALLAFVSSPAPVGTTGGNLLLFRDFHARETLAFLFFGISTAAPVYDLP
jgi:hypothetical protein